VILLLAACACPSFDEMTVVDPTGRGDVSLVEETLAAFATATGRDGVCATEIVLTDGPSPFSRDWEGDYVGPHAPLYVNANWPDVARATRHLLCHALDSEEGLSAANHDLFPAADATGDTVLWTDADRSAEVFADLCADGPSTDGLTLQLDARCGPGARGAGWSFVQESVYAAVEREEAPLSEEVVEVEALAIPRPADFHFLDIGGAGDALVALGYWADEVGYTTGIVALDPDSGAELARVPVRAGQPSRAMAELAQTDGPVVVVVFDTSGQLSVERVDLERGVVEGIGTVEWTYPFTWVESAGRGYLVDTVSEETEGGYHMRTRARAWVDGGLVELAVPDVQSWREVRAGVNGFEALGQAEALPEGDVLVRYDATLGWSTVEVGPFAMRLALYPWTADARLLVADGLARHPPLVLDTVTGVAALPADPCSNLGWGYDAVLDDRILVLDGSGPEGHWGFRMVGRP
jgi:hypothetical protein